jgi:hypothetical protein
MVGKAFGVKPDGRHPVSVVDEAFFLVGDAGSSEIVPES